MFKDIIGYDGLYKISDKGEVVQTAQTLRRKAGIIRSQLSSHGYHQVQLVRGLERKYFYIHRLIAIHFIPNPDNKKCINHINGIKTDNRIENLEWCDHKHNIQHSHIIGLKSRKIPISSREEIKQLRSNGMMLKDIAKLYNVSQAYICGICRDKRMNFYKQSA